MLAYPYSFLIILLQNFLFTTKEDNSTLKAIDFGLSDYVKPGQFYWIQQLNFFLFFFGGGDSMGGGSFDYLKLLQMKG
jgi:hypothetical protein